MRIPPGTTPDGWTADSSYSIVTDGTSRYQVDAAAADKFASADSARVNYYVQAKCMLTQLKTGANYLGLAARYTDAANNYLFYYNSSESRWKIGRYLAGVWLVMASGPSFTISVGTEYTLKFEIDGERLTGYVNGVLQCGTTDPALASGKIACYGNNTKGTFDDITVGQYSAAPVATPTPTPVAYITTNKSSYAVGENITVNFYNGPGNAKDWIGLYNNGAPDSPSIKWLYVNGTQTATIGISTGSVTFSGGLTAAGTYNARFFANDGYTRICDQVTFTVGATSTPTPTPAGTATPTPTPTPTTTPASFPAISLSPLTSVDSNQTINITISNAENPSHSTDWIGLYEANVTPDGDPVSIWWDYLPNLGITNGNGTFTFNPANISSANRSRYSNGNTYKFILAYDGSYVIQASTSFTVGSSILFETESLTVSGISSGDTHTVTNDANMSGGQGDLFNGTANNDYIQYTVYVTTSGTYNVKIKVNKNNNRGKYQLKIDGTNQGAVQDTYSSSSTYVEIDLGNVTFGTTGNKMFRFTCTGKNSNSTGYKLFTDYIKLTKQ